MDGRVLLLTSWASLARLLRCRILSESLLVGWNSTRRKGGREWSGVVSENDARCVFDSHCRLMYHGGAGLDRSFAPSRTYSCIWTSDGSTFNMRGRDVDHST